MIRAELLEIILENYTLPLNGTHGISHWARVLENGRKLAPLTGADLNLVELFAIFHDSKRQNERRDMKHGQRAANFLDELGKDFLELNQIDFDLLKFACANHTILVKAENITVKTCFDIDRLDIGRAGINIAKKFLNTEAARSDSLISWANQRAIENFAPALIKEEWNLEI